jgi:hypothetical protein
VHVESREGVEDMAPVELNQLGGAMVVIVQHGSSQCKSDGKTVASDGIERVETRSPQGEGNRSTDSEGHVRTGAADERHVAAPDHDNGLVSCWLHDPDGSGERAVPERHIFWPDAERDGVAGGPSRGDGKVETGPCKAKAAAQGAQLARD